MLVHISRRDTRALVDCSDIAQRIATVIRISLIAVALPVGRAAATPEFRVCRQLRSMAH